MQSAGTGYFLALQGDFLRLNDTHWEIEIPTCTGLVELVQNQDGSTALCSSLNGMRLKVETDDIHGMKDCLMTIIWQEEKDAGKCKDFEDFELLQPVGNEESQFIIRSLQTKKFVRVAEDKYVSADIVHPLDASKFFLIPRYLLQTIHPYAYITWPVMANHSIRVPLTS